MNEDKINNFINTHLRECLYMLLISCGMIWQTVPCLIAILVYLVLIRKYQLLCFIILGIGLLLLAENIYLEHGLTLNQFIKSGFQYNKYFLVKLFTGHYKSAFLILYQLFLNYLPCVSFIMAGLLGLIALIPNPAHAEAIKALQQGVLIDDHQALADEKVNALLDKMALEASDGTALGVSIYTGNNVIIPDKFVNQVMLVLGTTGGGKTITLRRFYHRAISNGHPLVIVDAKPDNANIKWLTDLAQQHNRPFYGFNCANYKNYDPLTDGGYTELKDKIISLKDQWENDYYRSIAEDYLQTTFEVLLKSNQAIDLKKVVTCLNYDDLKELVRTTKNPELIKRVESLDQYDRQDITGLQAHLNILVHSELGQYFEQNESAFRLKNVIEEGGVAYFALPALRFPSFSKVLGKLVINDLKAIVDRYDSDGKKIFTIFDEFSVFAGEQVLNLVNMGRGKGVHAIFGTQGLADLEKVDPCFKNQVLNCVNTLICHVLNDVESAETIASWVGTADRFTVTAQLNLMESDTALGSVRRSKEFIIHPDEIKQVLRAGEAFYVSKVGGFRWDKVKVKYG